MIKLRNFITTIIIGSLMGILTLIGQKCLPIDLNFLANSVSMWLAPAFLIPYFLKVNKKESIILSISYLIFCVLGYYIFEALLNNHLFILNKTIIFWLAYAVVGGSVFGLGAEFTNNKENIIKYLSMNLIPAVFISEGLNKLIHISEYQHMTRGTLLQIGIGLILYLVINNKNSLKKKNVISVLCLIIVGVLVFNILFGV